MVAKDFQGNKQLFMKSRNDSPPRSTGRNGSPKAVSNETCFRIRKVKRLAHIHRRLEGRFCSCAGHFFGGLGSIGPCRQFGIHINHVVFTHFRFMACWFWISKKCEVFLLEGGLPSLMVWLEYDPFLLGFRPILRGELFCFREGNYCYKSKLYELEG